MSPWGAFTPEKKAAPLDPKSYVQVKNRKTKNERRRMLLCIKILISNILKGFCCWVCKVIVSPRIGFSQEMLILEEKTPIWVQWIKFSSTPICTIVCQIRYLYHQGSAKKV